MADESSCLKTPLYQAHTAAGGRMVPFAGYLLPVQYPSGVIAEHMAVRTRCGLFDVSHMGEILLSGPDATANLNWLLTNDYTVMAPGQARYSPMCNLQGGVVDDLIVYKIRDDQYFIVVNASNKDKDFQWMNEHRIGQAELKDLSSQTAQLALQGPLAVSVLEKVMNPADIPGKYYTCLFNRSIQGINCMISRTGYTGEDGVEIYLAPDRAVDLWNLLLEAGKEQGLIPCGLGARDTLRLEASMPLYGHEMDDEITPLEAGLGTFVKMNKPDFIGRRALEEKGPVTRIRTGLKVTGRGIPREHQAVYQGSRQVGVTTSGTHCPYLKAPVAMALIDLPFQEPGTALEVDVRGRRVPVETTAMPFYKRPRRQS